MKLLKNILFIFTLLLAGAQASLQARQGDSCDDPIVLSQGFNQRLMQAGSYWYVANTFDLPMAITFSPALQSANAPYLELDFGCTPGEYDDPVLCNLFCKTKPAYVSMPYGQTPPKSYDEEGNVVYRIAFGEAYRDMLLSAGISYNIPVYIHATFYSGGTLEMEPDAFNNCMDDAKFMKLGDTVRVAANDKNRHVIVPYIQWQYDSIRYVWNGTTPCVFAVSNVCDFDPTNASDPHIIDGGPNNPIQPGGEFKVSSALLMRYVSDQKNYPNEAGMYFAKFYSEQPGVMKIERIPAPAPSCGATLMRLGEPTNLERRDSNTVYAMPSSWIKPMQFTSPTSHILKMYVGKNCDFLLSEAIAVYQFDRIENGHQLDLQESQLKALWNQKLANENYLYVRFECSDKTTVRPALWTPSDCELNTSRLPKDKKMSIAAKSKTVYSIYYPDWKDGDMTFSWENPQTACLFYIADTCQVPNNSVAPVFYNNSISPRSSFTIPQATIESWASKVDPDGYLYIRFYAQAKSNITVTTTAPEEEDDPCPTYDSIVEVVAWDSCLWRGQMYYASGTYHDYGTLDPETACYDSTFTLNLMIRNTTYDALSMTACDSIVYNRKTYRESGSYLDTLLVIGGHRVIMTLNLTVLKSTTYKMTIRQFTPYTTVTGKVLEETGIYRDTITNRVGCDSIIVYDLTIYNTDNILIEETGCDSIVIDGVRYTQTGEYVDTLIAPSGDRIVRTMRLTIYHSTYATERVSACDSYTSPRGKVYTQSGDYTEKLTNAAGCDSIITLHLTMGKTTYGEATLTSCEKYVSPWGHVYTESGDFTETGINAAGCDSLISLHLTIIPDCHTYDTVYFCAGLNYEHTIERGLEVTTYKQYIYEEPQEEWYMKGVIVASDIINTLVDFQRAESNLYTHYTNGLMPIKTIQWNCRAPGESGIRPIAVSDKPQWIANDSRIEMTVRFLCGEVYYSSFTTDIESVNGEQVAESVKRIENGQLVIIRGGKKYSVLGTRIE